MRLLELQVKKADKVLYDIIFCDETISTGPFSSVIIGINGSGKSRLLTIIAEILQNHFQQKRIATQEYDYYKIKYRIGNQDFTIEKNKEDDSPSFKTFAESFIVNDKFPFSSNTFYSYKGVRQVANAIFSNTIERQFITNILSIYEDGLKMAGVAKVFKMIGLEARCELTFNTKRYIEKARIRRTTLNALNRNNKKFVTPLSEMDKTFVVDFVDDLTNKRGGVRTFDLFSKEQIPFSITQFVGIASLSNVIYSIKLWKEKDTSFNLSTASSGEKHMLFSMLNLISSAEGGALILIDEPEVSLHPNWQMKYIDILKNIFSSFDIHFIIATHSHFLVSDLEGRTSSVIRLLKDRKTDGISGELIEKDTYGWTPDEILYEVFGVVSSRNRFVAEDIANILDDLSDSGNLKANVNQNDIDKLLRLKDTLNDIDPLKSVVRSILKKLER